MMDVKAIPICPKPDCETCALTAKLMEALGPTDCLADADVAARRLTSLAHAAGRTLYGHYRDAGKLGNSASLASTVEWLGETIIKAMSRVDANDPGDQRQ